MPCREMKPTGRIGLLMAAPSFLHADFRLNVSWAKGFKQGGWTTRLSAAIPSPADARFNPEYSSTFELGMKSEWLQHRLLANAAVYYTDYKGIQLNIQQGISPVYTNAGDAKIKGAELELQYIVGSGLQLNMSAAYIDAYYTKVNPNANFPQYALPDGTTVCPAGPPICGQKWVGVSALDAHITSFYFIIKWVPKLVVDMGFAPKAAAGVLTWANVGGAAGVVLFGLIATRVGLKALTIVTLVGHGHLVWARRA